MPFDKRSEAVCVRCFQAPAGFTNSEYIAAQQELIQSIHSNTLTATIDSDVKALADNQSLNVLDGQSLTLTLGLTMS